MWSRLKKNSIFKVCIIFLAVVTVIGIFAPYLPINNPNKVNICLKYAKASSEYPFGNDYLGRCIFSRVITPLDQV